MDQPSQPGKPDGQDKPTRQDRRDYYAHELDYHWTHVWNIFAWASGLLFTSLGGTLAVSAIASAKGGASLWSNPSPVGVNGKVILLAAVIVITVCSVWWMWHHASEAKRAKQELQRIDGITLDTLGFFYWMSHLGSSILTLIGVAMVVGLLIVAAP